MYVVTARERHAPGLLLPVMGGIRPFPDRLTPGPRARAPGRDRLYIRRREEGIVW